MKILKGKDTFTQSEINKLEELIRIRNNMPSSKQKGIRDKMRNIGFYGRDDWGITDLQLSDLHTLINNKEIKVIGRNTNSIVSDTITIKSKETERLTDKSLLKPKLSDLKIILDDFKLNCFDSNVDIETKIPDSPGNYILCLRKHSKLPTPTTTTITLTKFEGLDVIYTGIAGKSLRNRDYKQHFIGNNAGSSTLRKSLGVLFGYKLIPRDKDPNTGKTKYRLEDEIELSKWMKSNLIMYFLPTTDYKKIEIKLITHFNPPLNLKDNKNHVNAEFRKLLSNLRNNKN